MIGRWLYRGRHRAGRFSVRVGDLVRLAPLPRGIAPSGEVIWLDDSIVWNAKWYGIVTDGEPPNMLTATFEVVGDEGLESVPVLPEAVGMLDSAESIRGQG